MIDSSFPVLKIVLAYGRSRLAEFKQFEANSVSAC
jgi:hypothetical protein